MAKPTKRQWRRALAATLLLSPVLALVPIPAFALVPDIRIDDVPVELSFPQPSSAGRAPAAGEDLPDIIGQNSPEGEAARRTLAIDPARVTGRAENIDAFRLIGLTATTADDAPAGESSRGFDTGLVRVRADGTWSAWMPIDTHADDAPDDDSPEARRAVERGGVDAGAPVWVGHADSFELSLPPDTARVSVHLARETTAKVKVRTNERAAGAATNQPGINSRSAWGARVSRDVTYTPRLQVGIVHHSVSSNSYAPGDVPAILRSTQAYHMDTNGWDDIAYNFAVDRFGGMWEARGGGITELVQGGHSKGFNSNSVGVVMLGDFSASAPTSSMIDSVGRLLGWKLGFHGVDPAGSSVYRSNGNERYPEGQLVTVNNVIGHRDTGFTECPGNLAYSQLYSIRSTATVVAGTNGIHRFWNQTPAVGRNADGRLEVFAVDATGAMARTTQRSAGGTWTSWTSMSGRRFIGPPSVVNNTDGRQEVFAIGDDDAVWHTWQHSPNGSWSAWSSLGGVWFDFGGAVSTRNNDGRLEVFARGMDKAIYHSWQQTPGGTWTPWYSLGGSFAGDPAVGIAPDGRVEVFARSADNSLRHMWQVPGTATGWSPWVNRGGNITADPKVGTNADGRLEVFAPAGGGVAHQWQTTPGGGWSGWLPLVGVSLPADTPLLITRNADKRLEVFGVNASGALMHVWQKVPNGDWPTSWFPIGGPFRPQLGYGVNADQRMELVMLTGAEHDARHQWQAPGSPSGWSGIAPLP